MDSVQLWCRHFQHLLLGSQIKPRLRPINTRHGGILQGLGSNSGVLAGLLYSAVTVNNNFWGGGPWVVHTAGAIQNFFGYFMMWASVVGLIQRPPVALMCFFIFLSNHAAVFFATANLVTGVQSFLQSSGTIVGILKQVLEFVHQALPSIITCLSLSSFLKGYYLNQHLN